MLWLYQRMFFGTIDNPKNEKLTDLSATRMALHDAARDHVSVDWSLSQTFSWITLQRPVNAVVRHVRPNYPIPDSARAVRLRTSSSE